MFSQFRGKLQKLTYLSFAGHDRHDWLTLDLSDEELLTELAKMPDPELFLGHFSLAQIRAKLVSHGIMARLAELGYAEPQVEIRTDEVFTHRLYVFTERRDYEHILIELRLREGVFQPRRQFLSECELGPLPMIMVDWLLLQNPQRSFADRKPLPQQKYPGLGLLQSLIPLVLEAARETGRAGVLDVPEHYHGALFYSRWFRFLNPEMEGRFLAMQRDLVSHPLRQISFGVDQDCLVNLATGEIEKWSPGEQILPLGETLLNYFRHPQYADRRDRAFSGNRYGLDLEKLKRKMEAEKAAEPGGADQVPGPPSGG